jgi:hypothetical protein
MIRLSKLVNFPQSQPIIPFFPTYTFGLTGLQAVLLFFQRNWKYKIVYILFYLPYLYKEERKNYKIAIYPERVWTTSISVQYIISIFCLT